MAEGINNPPSLPSPSLISTSFEEGGYDCEFIEKPRELQSECPICLQVLREPYQVTCCGKSFCRVCIEMIKTNRKPCPTCNVDVFDHYPNIGLKQSLYDFKVYCSYRSNGCEWTGELRDLDKHFGTKSGHGEQSPSMTLCKFVPLKCSYCKKLFQRQMLVDHETEDCPLRPFSCDYCHEFESTYDKVRRHWDSCKCRPVACPHNCGVYPERQNLEQHVKWECAHLFVDCVFKYAGCTVRVHRNKVQEHMELKTNLHMALLAAHNSELTNIAAELKRRLNVLEKEGKSSEQIESQISGLSEKVKTLESEKLSLTEQLQYQAQKIELYETNLEKVVALTKELETVKTQLRDERKTTLALNAHLGIAPVSFTVDNFKQRQSRSEFTWNPRAFYTHPRGYKMRLCIDVYGNGPGKGTHISVFLCLEKGEFDDHLTWPFRGAVSIQLINQEEPENGPHHVEIVKYNSTSPTPTSARVMEDGKISKAWGRPKFIPHTLLVPHFVKNDCLLFRISKVELYQ